MRKEEEIRFLIPRVILCFAAVCVFSLPSAARVPSGDDFVVLTKRLSPSVVNIATTQAVKDARRQPFGRDFLEEFFGRQFPQPQRPTRSLGSGFIIDSDGLIVTNHHVIEGATSVKAVLSDGSSLDAEVVGSDAKTDIALLRVKTEKDLSAVSFGDSSATEVGEWVIAIGNPFGFGGTVTAGIVSAINRNIGGPYDAYIQTDAAINRGSSGGPLFNIKGEVIGVNTAIISPTGGSVGIGFAVPSATVQGVVSQLQQYGETRRGWLGVKIQIVTEDIAESLNLGEASGALIAEVIEGSPAEKGGLQAGDLITEFNGKAVKTMRDLPRMVAEAEIGSRARVRVVRDGRKRDFRVRLGRLEDAEQALAEKTGVPPAGSATRGSAHGLAMSAMSSSWRKRFAIPDNIRGVVILEVQSGSAAAEKGIRAGNVILQLARKDVRYPKQVEDIFKAEKKKGRETVLLLLWDRGGKRFLALPTSE